MTKFIIRVAAVLLASIVALIFVLQLAATQLRQIQGISIQHVSLGGEDGVVFTSYDVDTGVQFTYDYQFRNSSPDDSLSYETEWVSQQFTVYVRHGVDGERELLGTYEEITSSPVTTWSHDYQSIYIASIPFRENLSLYEIDVYSGEIAVLGSYDYDGSPDYIYTLSENLLFVGRQNYFALIDLTTETMNTYESIINTRRSRDNRYMIYGAYDYISATESEPSSRKTVLYLLDLETLEQTTIDEALVGDLILDVLSWSPKEFILPIILQDNRIALYHAETQSVQALPEQYRREGYFWSSWSNDGSRMIVSNTISGQYVLLDLESYEETPLIAQSPGIEHQLLWSRDDNYILITEDAILDDIAYQIYDAATGELVRDVHAPHLDHLQDYYISWMWGVR